MSQPRPLVDGLDRVLASLGAPSSDAITAVLEGWDGLVGDGLAGHCRPQSIARGRLLVEADGPAWADRLAWSEAQVLGRLDALVGAGVVEHVDVRVRR